MKQTDHLAGDRIHTGDIRILMEIAVRASQSKIAGSCLSPVLFGNNVVDLKRKREYGLGHPAVLAAPAGSFVDQSSEIAPY
jgi:hypothetical protein